MQKQTANIYASINGYYPKNPNETEIYTNLVDELRKTSEGQVSIKSLLVAKTPKVLWALIIVLSAVLFSGFYFTNYETEILATLTMTVMATAVALVAVIIYDMNDPFKFGFWALALATYAARTPPPPKLWVVKKAFRAKNSLRGLRQRLQTHRTGGETR